MNRNDWIRARATAGEVDVVESAATVLGISRSELIRRSVVAASLRAIDRAASTPIAPPDEPTTPSEAA